MGVEFGKLRMTTSVAAPLSANWEEICDHYQEHQNDITFVQSQMWDNEDLWELLEQYLKQKSDYEANFNIPRELPEKRLECGVSLISSLSYFKDDVDFLYLLADAAAIAFQYGNPDVLCSPLLEAKKSKENLVEAYAKYVKEYYFGKFGASLRTYDQQFLKNISLGAKGGDRLWWFQVCTEVAYFQVAPTNDSVRSPRIDARYHLDLCKNVFGEGIYPDVDMTNIYYGGTRIAGSKIIFTNGSQDPWRHASKQTSSPEKDMPSYITKCHNCGHGTDLRGCPQSPLNIQGDAGNCTSPEAVKKVRQQIIEHIDLWLSQCEYEEDDDDGSHFFGTARSMVSYS
ncbi:probable serine protease EDA2 [Phalaenopsis equestris]|uniref:probable serine protease EDA2 n=1 Tax=Phalaenopsis equestris TaxID=78828 RepID=UPI0009E1B099|nr:probable serine protease EDA2 [Phalaenopsis equestris]